MKKHKDHEKQKAKTEEGITSKSRHGLISGLILPGEVKSNNLLKRTGTLKGGEGSKVLFRSEPFAKTAWVR